MARLTRIVQKLRRAGINDLATELESLIDQPQFPGFGTGRELGRWRRRGLCPCGSGKPRQQCCERLQTCTAKLQERGEIDLSNKLRDKQ